MVTVTSQIQGTKTSIKKKVSYEWELDVWLAHNLKWSGSCHRSFQPDVCFVIWQFSGVYVVKKTKQWMKSRTAQNICTEKFVSRVYTGSSHKFSVSLFSISLFFPFFYSFFIFFCRTICSDVYVLAYSTTGSLVWQH